LKAWGLEFEKSLVGLTGRIMPSEAIIFANDATQPVDQKGDFTLAFRCKYHSPDFLLQYDLKKVYDVKY
jgi:hypothetical protein